jgi:hypothetical protein
MKKKYSYWAKCPVCGLEFHVYRSDKKPVMILENYSKLVYYEKCVFCLGQLPRFVNNEKGTDAKDKS